MFRVNTRCTPNSSLGAEVRNQRYAQRRTYLNCIILQQAHGLFMNGLSGAEQSPPLISPFESPWVDWHPAEDKGADDRHSETARHIEETPLTHHAVDEENFPLNPIDETAAWGLLQRRRVYHDGDTIGSACFTWSLQLMANLPR